MSVRSDSGLANPSAKPPHSAQEPLLKVRGLKKYFPVHKGFFSRHVADVRAVDGVDLEIYPGETVGLVGESGSGKTTVGRTLLRLIEPTDGDVHFDGKDVRALDKSQLRALREEMQIIFQDPYSSLNPRMTVGDIIAEGLLLHKRAPDREAADEEVARLLERVGLQASYRSRYPHEFSGGQRQRIGIARAIAVQPGFIVCDESVSALDVSVQAQVINLLAELQRELGIAYLFIAHDLSVVRHISDRVAVMYLGRVVETAPTAELFESAGHPYTQALLSAVPDVKNVGRKADRIVLQGDVPSPINPPSGCAFHTRCPAAHERCRQERPVLKPVSDGRHTVACHLYDEDGYAEYSGGTEGWADAAGRVHKRVLEASRDTSSNE